MSLGWFFETAFLAAGATITPNPYLNSTIVLLDKTEKLSVCLSIFNACNSKTKARIETGLQLN